MTRQDTYAKNDASGMVSRLAFVVLDALILRCTLMDAILTYSWRYCMDARFRLPCDTDYRRGHHCVVQKRGSAPEKRHSHIEIFFCSVFGKAGGLIRAQRRKYRK